MWTPSVIKQIYLYSLFFFPFFSALVTHYFAPLRKYFLYLFLHCLFFRKQELLGPPKPFSKVVNSFTKFIYLILKVWENIILKCVASFMLEETERRAWNEFGNLAGLPPLESAIVQQLPVFLRCERRKTGICRITADDYGGNVANARFPPLRPEENWNQQTYC